MEKSYPHTESEATGKIEIADLKLVKIPAGTFVMGSDQGLPIEQPTRRVDVLNSYYMGSTPITQRVWSRIAGHNPSRFVHPDNPVETISWDEAEGFCTKLSSQLGLLVRLPSEAEWEYACRAGSTCEYYFGNAESDVKSHAWFDLNSQDKTHPVGGKTANAWGLHDMVGNVWEWCCDSWISDYSSAHDETSPIKVPTEIQPRKVIRGGAWDMDHFRCRSAYRSCEHHHLGTSKIGLRVVVEIDQASVVPQH